MNVVCARTFSLNMLDWPKHTARTIDPESAPLYLMARDHKCIKFYTNFTKSFTMVNNEGISKII